MATRFAVKSGDWNDPTLWDNGAFPVTGDIVYPNGFSVNINTDINVSFLSNYLSNVYLPNMEIPAMTSNTAPSGVVNASGGTTTAYYAFDQNGSTLWNSGVNNSGWISYQFPIAKIIRRYRFVGVINGTPRDFAFQGSNDGTTWTPIESITGNTTTYLSGATVAANTTAYLYYRLNVTAAQNTTNTVQLYSFEMTESTATSYGANTGGSFNVPATLSGTRNLIFSNNNPSLFASGTTSVLTIAALTGNTVNITNSSPNGYIIGGGSAVGGSGSYVMLISGNATVVMNGNITGSTVSGSTTGDGSTGLFITNNANVTINGNIYTGNANWSAGSYAIQITASTPTLNVNGNFFGSSISSIGSGLIVAAAASPIINIVGTLTSNTNSCIGHSGGGTMTITGAVTSPSSARVISCASSCSINILSGIITAGTNSNAIVLTTGLITLGNSPLLNTNNNMAIYSPRIKLYSTAQVQWLFQNNAGTNTILYSAGASLGLPLTTNVRYPVQYGASNELTGQIVMPLPSNVRVGVPTDNTVGTGQLTAADFLAAIGVSTDPVAERLRTVSTVDPTGDQIAAFNV